MTIPKLRGRTVVIGGGVGALDAIDGAKLNDGDPSFVFSSGARFLPYRLNATSGATEANPAIISPDTNAGNKRHILMHGQFNLLYQNGVVFPATEVPSSGANTFDYYKEDSALLLNLAFGGASTGITYTTHTGSYTIMGNRVFMSGYMLLSSKGSATGAATLTGLPVAAAGHSSVNILLAGVTFANQWGAFVSAGASEVTLCETTEAGVLTGLADTDFANTSSIYYEFSYRR